MTALLWARARDPFHREWLSLKTSDGAQFSAIAVMPDRGAPFPVVIWCHGSGGSLHGDGETLRQFASLGLAAVGIEYDKTNQTNFDAQFTTVLDEIAEQPWAAKQPLNRSRNRGTTLSPSDGERDGVRGTPSTIIPQPSTKLAWIGNSLGAQRQLSFLARHPERQPAALVRLNGGMVEELRQSAERGTGSAEPTEKIDTSPSIPLPGRGGEGGTSQPATFNVQPATALHVWIAHGENDEVFPVADAKAVAEWLRESEASVELDVFPGRGHSFGEDQPLLVRRAAEFCAREMGATLVVPDNVRPSLWLYWLPVVLLGGVLLCAPRLLSRSSRREEAPTSPETKWSGRTSAATRIAAGVALLAAVVVSAAHLLLPLLPASPTTLRFARAWNVRPELRADFDWLASQSGAGGCRIRDLLDHLNLATVQRGQFAPSLSDDEWREFVLSPWIEGAGEDIGWRRDLWEFLAPRVRRETESRSAAQIVVRELRRRMLVKEGIADGGLSQAWVSGVINGRGREWLLCAVLRSVGVPARVVGDGGCQFWDGSGWRDTPEPLMP